MFNNDLDTKRVEVLRILEVFFGFYQASCYVVWLTIYCSFGKFTIYDLPKQKMFLRTSLLSMLGWWPTSSAIIASVRSLMRGKRKPHDVRPKSISIPRGSTRPLAFRFIESRSGRVERKRQDHASMSTSTPRCSNSHCRRHWNPTFATVALHYNSSVTFCRFINYTPNWLSFVSIRGLLPDNTVTSSTWRTKMWLVELASYFKVESV